MTGNTENHGRRRGSRWRIAAWGTAAALILLPLLAMQLTDEVVWDAADFAFACALVVGVGVAYELAARMTGNSSYRAAVGVALAAAFILVWANGAVGIIGNEENPANFRRHGVCGCRQVAHRAAIGTIMQRQRLQISVFTNMRDNS
jgi:hypothetical protein